jgi:hypothetical protein
MFFQFYSLELDLIEDWTSLLLSIGTFTNFENYPDFLESFYFLFFVRFSFFKRIFFN